MWYAGQGFSGLETFTAIMDMPGTMTSKNYDKIANKLSATAKDVAVETMLEASDELKNEDDEVTDVLVSCDVTWQKRGYTSNNGVYAVISTETGKVFDVEVMNKVCKRCKLKEPLKQSNLEAYAEWKLSHVCSFNYQGTSVGMDIAGARRIWNRSI